MSRAQDPHTRRAKIIVRRTVEHGRIVYHVKRPDSAFWDQHWSRIETEDLYRRAESGDLGQLAPAFHRWLPRTGRILEAGCGLGQVVLTLRSLGYHAEGVDWGEGTVERVKTLRPELPIRAGDVTRLDVPDGHFRGYVSLGVVEHRREGPEPFFREARRILAPGGIMLVSVPWFNRLRRLRARLGAYRQDPADLAFFQYAFTEHEFTRLLGAAGFEILELTGYDPRKGLKDELPLVGRLLRSPRIGDRLAYKLDHLGDRHPRLAHGAAHMLLVAARKPG